LGGGEKKKKEKKKKKKKKQKKKDRAVGTLWCSGRLKSRIEMLNRSANKRLVGPGIGCGPKGLDSDNRWRF